MFHFKFQYAVLIIIFGTWKIKNPFLSTAKINYVNNSTSSNRWLFLKERKTLQTNQTMHTKGSSNWTCGNNKFCHWWLSQSSSKINHINKEFTYWHGSFHVERTTIGTSKRNLHIALIKASVTWVLKLYFLVSANPHLPRYIITCTDGISRKLRSLKTCCYWSEHYENAIVQEGYTYIIDEVSVQRRWLHLLGNS